MIKSVTNSSTQFRFKTKLSRPSKTAKLAASTLLVIFPKKVAVQLAKLGATKVDGTLNGLPFPRAALKRDEEENYYIGINRTLREAADVKMDDVVTMEIIPVVEVPEVKMPKDLQQALAQAPKAHALWSDITDLARRDWILWIESAKRAETRARRIENCCLMLASGKRRVCCFDSYGTRMKLLETEQSEKNK